jgi:hypothetical protein
MALWVGVFFRQWVLAAPAELRPHRAYYVDRFNRHHPPRVPLVAGLSTGSTLTGFATGPFRGRLGRIARWGRDDVREF